MKLIEDVRDKHAGEEIWVIGAGSSLDAYPLSFFEAQICVGMNWVFSVFLDIEDGLEKFSSRIFYSVHEHRWPADWIAEHKPEFLKSCFFLLPPERRGDSSAAPVQQMVWHEDYPEGPYYMKWGLKGRGAVSATNQDFVDVAKCIAEKKGPCEYVCNGTTLHWAIQVAAVLGGTKIYVVGAEGQGYHMQKHGSLYPKGSNMPHRRGQRWRDGTKQLAGAFKPYGVEIVNYYYDKGEQKL